MLSHFRFPTRDVIFGLEDGIVSTLGVIVGIAAGTNNRFIVILSGLVVICVEALSMAAGTYLSEKSELDIEEAQKKHSLWHRLRHRHLKVPFIDSIYMGLSYIIGGAVPLTAFFFISPTTAIIPALIVSTITLFAIGMAKAKAAKANLLAGGLEMSLISLGAAVLGFVVGKAVPRFFNLDLFL